MMHTPRLQVNTQRDLSSSVWQIGSPMPTRRIHASFQGITKGRFRNMAIMPNFWKYRVNRNDGHVIKFNAVLHIFASFTRRRCRKKAERKDIMHMTH